MNIKSILAVTDLSASSNHAIDRAALLAVEHGALLRLMSAPAPGTPICNAGSARLVELAKQAAQRYGLTVEAAPTSAATPEHVAEEASAADLVVIEHKRERSIRSVFTGTALERVMRLSHCPVLVIKAEPAKRYGRILVAVDFSERSKELVKLAFHLDSDAGVELFHAISTLNEAKLRSAEVSYEVVQAFRDKARRYAHDRMFWLTDSFDVRRNRVMSAVGHGDPARQAVVQQEHVGADLIVVGKRRNSPFAEFCFGSVAHRVLSWASGDVLIVPHDHRPSTRAAAKMRIRAEQGDGK
ncbi:MAG: universal stress protein, partial [Polaromonas sp.]